MKLINLTYNGASSFFNLDDFCCLRPSRPNSKGFKSLVFSGLHWLSWDDSVNCILEILHNNNVPFIKLHYEGVPSYLNPYKISCILNNKFSYIGYNSRTNVGNSWFDWEETQDEIYEKIMIDFKDSLK